MIPESEIILRLFIAAALGLVIGFERERQDHAAGLRTHMILVTGAALAMTISINLAFILGTQNRAGDPARLAAQVISGIGFLGAGVIFRYGTNIRGLTTAASLWTVTIVGLAVGAGLYLSGIVTTVLLLVILTLLNHFEDRFLNTFNRVHIILHANYREGITNDVRVLLSEKHRKLKTLDIERDVANDKITLEMQVRILSKEDLELVVDALAKIYGVTQVKIFE